MVHCANEAEIVGFPSHGLLLGTILNNFGLYYLNQMQAPGSEESPHCAFLERSTAKCIKS